MKWEKESLSKLCTITSSKRCLLSDRSKTGVPFYCSKEIIQLNRGENVVPADFISEELYDKISETFGVPKTGDLLLTTRGTNGIPYIYKSTDRFYFADGNLSWFKDFSNRIIPLYLYYWFTNYEGKSKVDNLARGTAQKAIPISGLKSLKIELPPLPIQQRIASILSRYDDLIENYQQQIKLLEEAAQRLYKEWFVDLHFPGYENTKIVDGVPEGWKIVPISGVCDKIKAGGTPSRRKLSYWKPEKYRWVKTKELQDNWILDTEEYISEEGLNNCSAKLFPPKTILMAIYASPTLGRLGLLYKTAACNQAALGFVVNEKLCSTYWLYLKLFELREYFNSVARGAGQQNISADVVKNKEIICPNKQILDSFTRITTPIFNNILSFTNQITLLTEARDRLLPKLMSGEIEV